MQKLFKLFREEVLKITLKEMSEKTGVNLKTISAFENGKSNNIQHMKIYVFCCENDEQITILFHNLKSLLTEGKK